MPEYITVIEELEDDVDGTLKLQAKRSTCIMPISVGQPYHEATDLAETIAVINTTKFERVIFVVACTLQRYTKIMKNNDLDETLAHEQAEEDGIAWINRNLAIISRLEMPFVITRWDQWIKCNAYLEKRTAIDASYAEKKSKFHSSIDKVIRQFINGFQRTEEKLASEEDLIDFDMTRAVELCREYLLEEMAVLTMWRDNSRPDLLAAAEQSFIVYNFGNSSTNKTILNCLKQLCTTENLGLLKLQKRELTHKKQPKKSKQKPAPTEAKHRPTEPTTSPTFLSGHDITPEEERELRKLEQLLLGNVELTLKVSQLSLSNQIALLQGVVHQVNDMSNQLAAKLPGRSTPILSIPGTSEDNKASQKESHLLIRPTPARLLAPPLISSAAEGEDPILSQPTQPTATPFEASISTGFGKKIRASLDSVTPPLEKTESREERIEITSWGTMYSKKSYLPHALLEENIAASTL